VLIDVSADDYPADLLTGILRHELGHTLGFRHEHIRPESGASTIEGCVEDSNWRALTTYDRASVMHYPQCNGIDSWDLLITAKDAAGAESLYGAPDGTPPDPPVGTPVTETFSGSVARRTWANIGSGFAVAAGTSIEVRMTGSGDPDLYVRFGSNPTTSTWNCRPYLSGATETCTLDVPAGQSSFYVRVYGYTAGTYSVSVTYTKP
jgi:hypothetical protein